MRATKQIFVWLFLTIFSMTFFSCVENEEEDNITEEVGNAPGNVTFNDTKESFIGKSSSFIFDYTNKEVTINTKTKDIPVEVEPGVYKNTYEHKLTFKISNVTDIMDLVNKTIVQPKMPPIPGSSVILNQETVEKLSQSTSTSTTISLLITSIEDNLVEGTFNANMQNTGGEAENLVISLGKFHSIPVYYK